MRKSLFALAAAATLIPAAASAQSYGYGNNGYYNQGYSQSYNDRCRTLGQGRTGAGALIEAGATIRVLNRSRDRAEALAADLGPSVSVADETALPEADLVINALSIQPSVDLSALKPGSVVMDMTYKPVVTPFLGAAREAGLTTVDGLAMLIGQAGPSFRAIFGVAAPDLDPRPLLLSHLGETA